MSARLRDRQASGEWRYQLHNVIRQLGNAGLHEPLDGSWMPCWRHLATIISAVLVFCLTK